MKLDYIKPSLTIRKFDTPQLSPLFQPRIYKLICPFFQECVEGLDPRSRDLALLTSITGMGAILSGVETIYDGRQVFCTLNVFISAPAGSGKQIVNDVRYMFSGVHELLLEKTQRTLIEYNQELMLIDKTKRTEAPPRPPERRLFMPANISNIEFCRLLSENNGVGLVVETEADTLSSAQSQKWGITSETLRCNFHHERIEIIRAGIEGPVVIDKPRASTVITGTPKQLTRLIPGIENGEFSRYAFYTYEMDPKWRDPSPFNKKVNLTQKYADLSKRVVEMHQKIGHKTIKVSASKEQWDLINKSFSSWLDSLDPNQAKDFGANIYRMGLITIRVAVTFSVVRRFSEKQISPQIEIHDDDLTSALELSHTLLEHAFIIFSNSTKTATVKTQAQQIQLAEGLLRDGYNFVEIADELGLNKSTVSRWFKEK